jgi:hypothetical protein
MSSTENLNIYKPRIGDLVYIIDPGYPEPIKMGMGLVVGDTKIWPESHKQTHSTPVLWDRAIHYLDKPYWLLEVVQRAIQPS